MIFFDPLRAFLRPKKPSSGPVQTPSPNLPKTPSPLPRTDPVFNDLLGTEKNFGQQKQIEWLKRSEDTWIGKEWSGCKVLGKGSYGVAGLFIYHGRNKSAPRRIVVKQTAHRMLNSLRTESKMLHKLTGTRSSHITKLYKGCHQGFGTGTMPMDPIPFSQEEIFDANQLVARMYIEYADSGDLSEFCDKIQAKNSKYVIPEEHLWRILLCLGKALLLLEQGTESPDVPDAEWLRKICHFDLKPENVVIATSELPEHKMFPSLKLCDFGLSLFEPTIGTEKRSPQWIKSSQWRASPGWAPPEQVYLSHPNRDIGAQTGVWCVGAMIYRMICKVKVEISNTFLSPSHDGSIIKVSGNPNILMDPRLCPYSNQLINTVVSCLAYDPIDRLLPTTLVTTAQSILRTYDTVTRAVPKNPLWDFNKPDFNRLPPGETMQNIGPIARPVMTRSFEAVLTHQAIRVDLSPDNDPFELLMPPEATPQEIERVEFPFDQVPPTPKVIPLSIRTRAQNRAQNFGRHLVPRRR